MFTYDAPMCRNISNLRGLEPPATSDEVRAAALQYVRKVGSLGSGRLLESAAVSEAVAQVATATERLLASLPARRQPPKTAPPGRRRTTQIET
jgi:hypothetical protein